MAKERQNIAVLCGHSEGGDRVSGNFRKKLALSGSTDQNVKIKLSVDEGVDYWKSGSARVIYAKNQVKIGKYAAAASASLHQPMWFFGPIRPCAEFARAPKKMGACERDATTQARWMERCSRRWLSRCGA